MRVEDVDAVRAQQARQAPHLERVEPVAATDRDELDAGRGQTARLGGLERRCLVVGARGADGDAITARREAAGELDRQSLSPAVGQAGEEHPQGGSIVRHRRSERR